MSYFPYGEERTATANNFNKFGTYHRDAGTGLDYADQRHYSNIHGRFLTPDPYVASAGVESPGSWNRYSYVEGDPINWRDPSGLFSACPEGARSGPDGNSCVLEDWLNPIQLELMRYYFSGAYDYSSPYSSQFAFPPAPDFGLPPGPLPQKPCNPANMPQIQFDKNRPMLPQALDAMENLGVLRFIDVSSIRADGGGILLI